MTSTGGEKSHQNTHTHSQSTVPSYFLCHREGEQTTELTQCPLAVKQICFPSLGSKAQIPTLLWLLVPSPFICGTLTTETHSKREKKWQHPETKLCKKKLWLFYAMACSLFQYNAHQGYMVRFSLVLIAVLNTESRGWDECLCTHFSKVHS